MRTFDLPEEYDGTLTANFEITIDSVIYGALVELEARIKALEV